MFGEVPAYRLTSPVRPARRSMGGVANDPFRFHPSRAASALRRLPGGVGGFRDARVFSTAGAGPGRRAFRGTPDFLSHDTDRRALDLLPGGRSEGRADDSPAARRSRLRRGCSSRSSRGLSDRYHLVAPDYPGFGHSDWPDPKKFAYTFDHYAEIMNHFTEALGLSRYTLYMQDYGGPVGFRMALAHPDRIEALIVQDAVAHNEGLGANWKTRRAFWADRAANETALRANLLSLRDDADAPCRERSQRGALRPGSLDRRIRVSQPARPGRHPERPLLRLPHERRGVPQVAGLDAREAAAASRPSGASTTCPSSSRSRRPIAATCRRPRSTFSTRAISRSTRRRTRSRRSSAASWSRDAVAPPAAGRGPD